MLATWIFGKVEKNIEIEKLKHQLAAKSNELVEERQRVEAEVCKSTTFTKHYLIDV